MRREYLNVAVVLGLMVGARTDGKAEEPAAPFINKVRLVEESEQTPAPRVTGSPFNPLPGSVLLPGPPPPCGSFEDCNGPLLAGDALLDRPNYPPPGWFAAMEIGVVGPHLRNTVQGRVTIGGVKDLVYVPTASLDWTGYPRLELGYRFTEGAGELLLSYRSLYTEGGALVPNFDPLGSGNWWTRLQLDAVDLDYSNREYSLAPRWDMKWKAGLRFSRVFFDSGVSGTMLAKRISNEYQGVGPHVGLDLWRSTSIPSLALFTRIEGAALVGRIEQHYSEAALFGAGSGLGVLSGSSEAHGSQTVPILNFQAGLGWTPCLQGRWVRFSAGYLYENWWYIGTLNASRAELTNQGFFLRGEWRY